MRKARRIALAGGIIVAVIVAALLHAQGGAPGHTVTWDAATAHVVVADSADGRVLRSVPLAEPPDPGAAQGLPSSNNGAVTLAADQQRGYAFVAELNTGLIHALSARDGHILWRASLLPATFQPDGRTAMQAPVVDERAGRVISADIHDGRLVVLRESDGHQIVSLPIPPGGLDIVVVRKTGRVLVFHGGKVDVLDDVQGKRLRAVTIGRVYQYGPAIVLQRTARVFLADTMARTVTMLDGATGRILRVTHMPFAVGFLVSDERAAVVRAPDIGSPGTRSSTPMFGKEGVIDGRRGVLLRIGPASQAYLPSNVAVQSDPWDWMPSGLRQLIPFVPPPPMWRRRPYALYFPHAS